MPFQLPDLLFAKDALQPHMSAETLDYHHGKHHKAYVTKTTELLQEQELARLVASSESSARPTAQAITSYSTTAGSCGTTAFSGNAWRPPRAKAKRQACAFDRRRLRQRRRDAPETSRGSRQSFRQRLGLAGARPRQSADHLAARCRHAAGSRRDGAVVHARCAGTRLLHRLSQRGPKFAQAVLSNIVNWDFVAENLEMGGDRPSELGAVARVMLTH